MPRGKYTRGKMALPEATTPQSLDNHRKLRAEFEAFQDFRAEVLPKLRAMLSGKNASAEMRAWAQAYLTARQISIALDPDAKHSDALKAIDAVTHQNEGKPTERHEIKHQLEQLSDQELDAVLASKLANAAQAAIAKKPTH